MHYDGTNDGYIDSLDESTMDEYLNNADEETDTYWTGPWPEINYKRTPNYVDDTCFHVKVDLLRAVTVCYVNPGQYFEPQDSFGDEFILEYLFIGVTVSFLFFLMSRSCDIFEDTGMTNLYALGASYAFWVAAILFAMITIPLVTLEYNKDWGWASAMFLILGIGCLTSAFGVTMGWLLVAATAGVFSSDIYNLAMENAYESVTGIFLKKLYFVLAAGIFFMLSYYCYNGGIE